MAKSEKGKEESGTKEAVKEAPNAGFMDSMEGAGFEGMGASDFQIPFLRILQPLSPQVLDGDEHIEGAKAGYFFNSLTNKVYGNEINVIPLKCITEWLIWGANRGPLKNRVPVGGIPTIGDAFSKLVTPEGDEVVETMTIFLLIEGHIEEGPVAFPLSKTNLKHAKKLNTMLHATFLPSGKRAPYFSSVWTLKTSVNKNDKGTWYSLGVKGQTNIERKRWITADEFSKAVQPGVELLKDEAKLKLLGAPDETRQIEGESAF